MQVLLFALLLQAHSIQEEHVSVRSLPVTSPVSVVVSRGYFSKKGTAWSESHRNEIERGMYDARGRLIGIVEVGLLDSIYKFHNTLDAAGKVTETTITTTSSIHGRERNTFDGDARLTEKAYYDGAGELQARVVYQHSSRDRISLHDEYERVKGSTEPVLVRQVKYAYSNDGKQVRMTTYAMRPAKRILQVVVTDAHGAPQTETTYDEWGKLDKEYRYQYEFSPAGIWTRQTKLKKLSGEDTVPVDVLYRQLYYIPGK